ncbi:hypothetical protein ABPG72_015895 [Tetrahymena utriculariae]
MQNHAFQHGVSGNGESNNNTASIKKSPQQDKRISQQDIYMLQKKESKHNKYPVASRNAINSNQSSSKSVSLNKTEIKFTLQKSVDAYHGHSNLQENNSPYQKFHQTHERVYTKQTSREGSNNNNQNIKDLSQRPMTQSGAITNKQRGNNSPSSNQLPLISKDRKDAKIGNQVDQNNEIIQKILQQNKQQGCSTPKKSPSQNQSFLPSQKTLQILTKEELNQVKYYDDLQNKFNNKSYTLSKSQLPHFQSQLKLSAISARESIDNIAQTAGMAQTISNLGSSSKQQLGLQLQMNQLQQHAAAFTQSDLLKHLNNHHNSILQNSISFNSPQLLNKQNQTQLASEYTYQASALKNNSIQEITESPRKMAFISQKDLKNPQDQSNKIANFFFPSGSHNIDELKSEQHQNNYQLDQNQQESQTTNLETSNNNQYFSKIKDKQMSLRQLNTNLDFRKGSQVQSDATQSPIVTPTEATMKLIQQNQLKVKVLLDSSKALKSYGELQEILQPDKIKPFNTYISKSKPLKELKDSSESSSSKSVAAANNQSFHRAYTASQSCQQTSTLQTQNLLTKGTQRPSSPFKTSTISSPLSHQVNNQKTHYNQIWIENIRKMQNPLYIQGTEEIEESLKKELPNINSDVPSNRNEVTALQKWFESGIKSFQQSDSKKQFKYFYVTFNELLRQITLDCAERGYLLKEIVFKIVEYYQKQISEVNEEIQIEKSKNKDEVINTRRVYEGIFLKKEAELAEIKKLNEEYLASQANVNKTITSLQIREKDLNEQLNNLKSISQFLKAQLKKISEDNLKLRMKLKKRKYNLDGKIVKQIESDPQFAQEIIQQNQFMQNLIKKEEQLQSDKKLSSKKQIKKNSTTSQVEVPSFTSLVRLNNKEISNFSSDSDTSFDDDIKKSKNGKDEFSLLQPYIRKHTLEQQTPILNHLNIQNSVNKQKSRRNSLASNRSSNQFTVKDFKRNSATSQSGIPGVTQNLDINKKILQIAIQEQIEENEISSFSSEDSKLIIDEAQNDMVDIAHLNAIGFQDIDSVVKKECAETQVNASLIQFGCESVEIQTDLMNLTEQKYDEFLIHSEEIDSLIDFRISGIKQFQIFLEQEGNTINIAELQRDIVPSGFKPLKMPANIYKGKFNKFERLYEESLQQVALVNQQLEKMNVEKNQLFIREKELLEEISQIKMQLKKEKEEEQKRIQEHERKRKEEEEEEKKRKKKAQEIPDKWKNYQYLVYKKKFNQDGNPNNYIQSNAPKLGQRAIIDFDKQYQTDLGQIIIDKLQNKKYNKFKNFMPVSTILKQINLIYQDRIKQVQENPRFKEISCPNFSYIFLTKIFGLKKIVDQKFIIFILSLKRYMQIFRINMFARFLGILEQKSLNFTLDEFNKYIETLDYIQNQCNIGKDLEISESETKYFVPYIKVAVFVGNFADARFTTEETTEFKKEVDQLRENDQRYPNVQVTDFDVFVHKMLNKYRMLVNRAKTYVINAFNASDLDGNGVCNLEEFLILNRNIEADNYNEEILTQIFNENADNFEEGEPNLTFNKFAVVCVDFNLFSDEAQDKFLNIRLKREIDLKFEDLKKVWPQKKQDYERKINSFKFTDQKIKDKWMEITQVLNERLTSNETQELKPLLIAEKILERELEFLEIFEQEGFEDEEALNKYMTTDEVKTKITHLPENAQQQALEKIKNSLVRKSTFSVSQTLITEDQTQIKAFLQSITQTTEKDLKKVKVSIKTALQEKLEQYDEDQLVKQIDLLLAQNQYQNQTPRDIVKKQESFRLIKNNSEVSNSEQLNKQQIELLIFAKQEIENSAKK